MSNNINNKIKNNKTTTETNLDKPQYNSTVKLLNKLEQLETYHNKYKDCLDEQEIEKINEKASSKLNMHGKVFDGLVSVEPDQEDFLKYLGG